VKLLNKRIDYAFSALQYIKRQHPRPVMAQEIARELSLSKRYLSKVLRTLVERRIIDSRFGPKGGYTLAQEPRKVSFIQVMEALGSAPSLLGCLEEGGSKGKSRPLEEYCLHRRVWHDLDAHIRKVLAGKTLGDL